MTGKISSVLASCFAVTILYIIYVEANPAIATSYDALEICIENCAQCKKMLGAWFEGPRCAESCIKFKGKMIPECENFASIAQFLNKL
ncbi:eclosion hormone-like [Colias croceus]|uniref:eclosion hormone-like n=1 Tax=Colias crocea TaxID=72248 RepID=UPI001E27A1A2|nr:eclosion hormone-like [Colias croceus]XP_045496853.1 eclosion hormone-like [Colias croceus]XP_045496854.1 eclosion hormone-like [Colias croceus]CAG4964690.1 unnamed protein product [Colias eurytheme]